MILPQRNRRTQNHGVAHKWLLFLIPVLILMLIGFLFSARPVYRWYKGHKAADLARQADAFVDEEDWKQAIPLLSDAYKLSSRNPEVLRSMARLYGFFDLNRQRQMLRLLQESGKATPEDMRSLGSLELKLNSFPRAVEIMNEMLKTFPGEKESLRFAVTVETARRDFTSAEEYLEQIHLLDPEDTDAQIGLARLRIQSPFEEKRRSGWDEIFALARRQDDAGTEAVRILLTQTELSPARAREAYELVNGHEFASEAEKVGALKIWHDATTSKAEQQAIVQGAIEKRRGRSHKEMREFFIFLNTILEHQKVIELLPKEVAFGTPELLSVYITSLIQDGQMDAVRRILESEDELEASSEISFIKAQCVIFLKDGIPAVRKHLEDSFALAMLDKKYEMFAHIASMAEHQGLLSLAERVYRTMAGIPQTRIYAYQQLLLLANRKKDLPAMRDTGRRLEELLPTNPEVVKLNAYWDLLVGTHMEVALDKMLKMTGDNPLDESARMILAFARYRTGEFAVARELADSCDFDRLKPSYRVVCAAIRGAAGDVSGAVSVAEGVPRSLLLEEEVDMLRQWLPLL